MERCIVTGEQVKRLFLGGLEAIETLQQEIDRLNVFPVPDGDTGRNMYLTMAAAVKELEKSNTSNIRDVGEAVARGSLMGARGNSGVILSQLIRGFTDGLKGKEHITVQDFADAWHVAVASAYRAVIKPVEGTMLTVAKSLAQGIKEATSQDSNLEKMLEYAISKGYETLEKTPEMLPVLKKAGVVDAGGKGLLVILEGGLNALSNDTHKRQVTAQPSINVTTALETQQEQEIADITYMYCTEFLLKADPSLETTIKKQLNGLGGSLVTGNASKFIKIHIHTNNPGRVLEFCQEYGTLHDIKIDNMRDQWEKESDNINLEEAGQTAEIGIVAVGAGEGIKQLFYNLGASQVIEGGQTMNPPVEEFVQAIEKTPARQVLVLPNNKNLILAAKQAQQLVNRPIEVIPSKNIPAGISALLVFNDSMTLEENKDRMCQQLEEIKVGEVTYAIRDAILGEQEIKKGQLIGIFQGEIVATGSTQKDVVLTLLEKMVDKDDELVTLYSGEGVTPDTVEEIFEQIKTTYPELEVDTHHGGQPIYYFLISVE